MSLTRLLSLTKVKPSPLLLYKSSSSSIGSTTTSSSSSLRYITIFKQNNNNTTSTSATIMPFTKFYQHCHQNGLPTIGQQQQRCWYTPMTKEEEDNEKVRISTLTAVDKDQELRKLNRDIAKLQMLRSINTGELETWSGRYKQLVSEYGIPFSIYYGVCWFTTACLIYSSITVFDIDVMLYITKVDTYFNWNLAHKVDPQLGTIGATVAFNELIEPIRLPFVIFTVKPLVDTIFPNNTKY
jgi:hypothetical protein